ncbi:MAG: hypothetical protein PGN33_20145 [Methylobacterium radiotolerans]
MITDVEYHLWVYKRLPPEGSPELSGTGFLTEVADASGAAGSNTGGGAKPEDVSPKTDSVGRAASPARTRATATNRRQTRRLVNTPLVNRAWEMIKSAS